MTTTTGKTTQTSEAAAEHCGQCGAPADHEQRYCLDCGFHRRNAPDPVARYLSEASAARARVAAAEALAAQRRRAPRIGLRLTVALVALALVVGIVLGSSTGGASSPVARTETVHTTTHKQSPGKSKLHNATGSNYVNQENNLPNSVSP